MATGPWTNLPSKATIVPADILAIVDSEDIDPSTQNKIITISQIQASVTTVGLFTWNATDEDSIILIDTQYVTEVASISRTITDVILSLKNAPTGTSLIADVLQETALNSNTFATIFNTQPAVTTTTFSGNSTDLATTTWTVGRRLRLDVTQIDTNSAATGLKVSMVTS